MKHALVLKVVSLVVLGCCSSLITSLLLGQSLPRVQNKKNGKQSEFSGRHNSRTITATTTETRLPSNGTQKSSRILPSAVRDRLVAEFALQQMRVEADRAGALIAATASMCDTRRGISYMWSVSIKDSTSKNTFFAHHYDDQVFHLDDNSTFFPTFHALIPLQSGTYRVHLKVLHVTETSDLKKLKESDAMDPNVLLSGVRTVVIP